MNKKLLIIIFIFAFVKLDAQVILENVGFLSGSTVAVEGCNDTLVVDLNARLFEDTLSFEISTTSAADENDYNADLDELITFFPGENQKLIPIAFFTDTLEESETIVIRFTNTRTGRTSRIQFTLYDSIPLNFSFSPDTLCLQEVITLRASGAGTYRWETLEGDFLGDADTLNYYPRTRENVVLIGRIHECMADTVIEFSFYPDNLSLNSNELFICKDADPISVMATTSPDASTILWSANREGILDTDNGSTVIVDHGNQSAFVYAEYQGPNCTLHDTLYIQVDSLPDSSFLENVPLPDPMCNKYCVGDSFTINSNFFQPTLYPDVEFSWEPSNGSIIRGMDEENIFVVAQDSAWYIRTSRNNACMRRDSIYIEVIPPILPLNLRDTIVCANEPVQLEINLDPDMISEIEWMPETGLSCSDCPNPVATVAQTTTFMVQAKREDCCPSAGTVTIIVSQPSLSFFVLPDTLDQRFVGDEVTIVADLSSSNVIDSNTIEFDYEGNTVNATSATYTLNNEGANVVNVTYIDIYGCQGSSRIEIDAILPDVRIPNAFTPNDDGTNDLFRPLYGNEPMPGEMVEEFMIWARWGDEVYTFGGGEPAWDGMHNGDLAPPEVYLYYLKAVLPNGSEVEYEGDVTLIR